MRIIDLTLPVGGPGETTPDHETYFVPLSIRGRSYQGICHNFKWHSMTSTYIDFPGHIAEFDNGIDAGNMPIEKLFLVETTLVRLDPRDAEREITGVELERAAPPLRWNALIIHARGNVPFYERPEQIPYYGPSAIEWITSREITLFISDVYEKQPDQQGIFVELFRRGITCVCCMVNLHEIEEPYLRVCALPLPVPGARQLPCRLLAIEGM